MPGSVFAFLNGFGQQGWADMSIMNIEVLAGGKRYRFQSEAGTSLKVACSRRAYWKVRSAEGAAFAANAP